MKTSIPFQVVADLGYSGFGRGVYKHRVGWHYHLDKISEEKKQELLDKYNNIHFLSARRKYSPEIEWPVLFVADVPFDAPFEQIRKDPSACYVAKLYNGTKLYSVTSVSCHETETKYFGTKKEAGKYIRANFAGLEKAIRLNDLACA